MNNLLQSTTVLKGTMSLNMFQLAREVDTGQATTNPFILCKRVMASNEPVSLDTLNSILAFNNIVISQQEFDYLLSLKPTPLPFPLPVNDESVISVIGSSSNKGKSNPTFGVYQLASLDGVDNYVGSSSNLALRLRYYYSKKGLAETRPVAKSLASKGLDQFNLSVYVLNLEDTKDLGLASMQDLILSLEQLKIIQVKPSLNVLYVVNGLPSAPSTYKQVGTPVYIYNSSKNTLLYTAESGTQLEMELGVKVHSMNRSIKSGKPMYGKYVFTRAPIYSATASLLDVSVMRNHLASCHKNRAQLRDYNKPTANMTPVIITDLANGLKYPFISKRKACLFTQDYPVHRQVNQLEVIKFKLPFTHKDWLFEADNIL